MKFLSPESALYLYESTICPCMEYCCHVGAGAPNCYLELLDKLQKWICRTCCFSWTIGSLSKCVQLRFFQLKFFFNFFYRYYLVDVLQNCLDWFHFLFLEGGLLVILTDYMIFQSPFLDVTRMSMSIISFFAQLDSGILYP